MCFSGFDLHLFTVFFALDTYLINKNPILVGIVNNSFVSVFENITHQTEGNSFLVGNLFCNSKK